MARLSNMPPRLKSMHSGLRFAPQDKFIERAIDRKRAVNSPWRKWYNLARWRRLRHAVLLRDSYTCRMCKRMTGDTSALVADHIRPHRGDEALFWDARNVQCLCAPCHNGRKQAMEKRGEI